ncbi:aspartyl-phosphate phosphatase Spo0E family protein [Thermoanaerobacter thermohydrosulfuricus]
MVLYKIALLSEKISEMKNELDKLIENDADKRKILELSQKIDVLIVEYMKLKRRISNDFVEK